MTTTNLVNLDALIPREDFAVEAQPPFVSTIEKISITHLDASFFGPALRKPDFQRETNNWSPTKVVDLVRAFVDGDLIPAVILWKAGSYIFVIDGAHRLGALMAWIFDDYGDRKRSLDFFGGIIPTEQREVATRTRQLINKKIGSYQEYVALRSNPAAAPPNMKDRLSNLAANAIVAQWVPTTDALSAENSFFKINQSATPIDATERRILKARRSASAVAARAITHGGTGHKYWSAFEQVNQHKIEQIGARVYHALYDPPITGEPVTTLDVPVAGRGYNVLPFVFDLVNESNGLDVADTSAKREINDELGDDPSGRETISYLENVERRVQRITGDLPMSLGVHPVVYFYGRSGTFQPIALLATSRLLEELAQQKKLKAFIKIRSHFEEFIIQHKEAMSLLIHKFGSGGRSIPWVKVYYNRIIDGFLRGLDSDGIQLEFARDADFAFLTAPKPPNLRGPSRNPRRPFSAGTKTAAFLEEALPNAVRCKICRGLIHKNSVHFDHIIKPAKGGTADMRNAQVTHPYCDSVKN